jgi:uncharacterized protein YbjT (DUF2867 family)
MLQRVEQKRVMVTGATGFLGFRVAAALIEAGAQVSVLIQREQEEKIQALADKVKIFYGDLWNRGSLKGQGRGHHVLVHLVGSTRADPVRGMTFQQVNLVAARNAIGMAVSDGITHFALLSVAALPGMVPGEYIRSKREAEEYLIGSGLQAIIIRAPFLYIPSLRNPFISLEAGLGVLPPFRWLVGRYMPLSVDVTARGIAAAALNAPMFEDRILYAKDLRKLARSQGKRPISLRPAIVPRRQELDLLDETPFGWLPSTPNRRRRDG